MRSNIDFGSPECVGSSKSFLTLPIDILFQITKSLEFRDLISLSLTTKGLRYLRPKRPDNRQDARCFVRIHRKFLGSLQQSQHKLQQKGTRSDSRCTSNSSVDKCPYCQHPLCPPTCETALFLDADSGFFFPRHMFPTHIAKFKYRGRSAKQFKTPPQFPSRKRRLHAYYYSTIWCEHHRCPRDMLARNEYYNIKNGLGVPLFLKEYHHWRQTKLPGDEVGVGYWVHDRWKVGYRLPPDIQNPTDVGEDDLIPIHEKFFYDSMCLHCLGDLSPETYWNNSFRQTSFLAYRCSCYKDSKAPKEEKAEPVQLPMGRRFVPVPLSPVGPRGCNNCGYVSTKFTRIEAFDYVEKREDGAEIENSRAEGYWVYLATECKLGPAAAGYPGDEKQRMYPTRPEENAKFLEIVRGPGYGLMLLSQPKIGIQDLPYKVIRQILEYLSLETDDTNKDKHFFALRSSYCFVKGWYGGRADVRVRENLTEPYNILSIQLPNSGLRTFEFTDTYISGQRNHKARKLKPAAHRAYRMLQRA